ncbi:MAG TPA: 16S rRNA (cytosine(1402)-N(4))-methyltransferase RsmH [Actinomycetota bacterium]|nr:16S rRNA (cytosine(1402)-N(4))-methyltransferase RsmH [Actinomycetota bacterium]
MSSVRAEGGDRPVAHEPVLAEAVAGLLEPVLVDGGSFVDATIGRGGHARRLLDAAPRSWLIGVDRDPDALEACRADLSSFGDRARLVRDDFKNLSAVLERLGVEEVRGVLLDLGVSSPQLDESHRGFSFRADGPLDMRMDPDQRLSADTIVNTYAQDDLARIIRLYGEERFAKRVARAIVAARPIRSTEHLAEVVTAAIPAATRRTGGHPARRTFQAIRIEVNAELSALEEVLPQAVSVLATGGRVVVISYHSLEDRIVKRFFAEESKGCVCPPDFPICACDAQATLRVLTSRPVRATAEEAASNPRSTAGKLRAAEKIGKVA